MRHLITDQVKQVANKKCLKMPLGTLTRLKVNNEITDIVISPTSSGIWFYHVTGTITKQVYEQIICFISYNELKTFAQ